MDTYTEQDRLNDFEYFISIYQDLYNKYGKSFIALKNKKILGVFKTVNEAIQALSDKYKLGTYIIQECKKFPDCCPGIFYMKLINKYRQ